MNEETKLLLAIFTGLAAGTALGLLLAPKKKEDHLNGHTVSLAHSLKYSQDQTAKQLQHLENIKNRLMNTFQNDDFSDHVEHV